VLQLFFRLSDTIKNTSLYIYIYKYIKKRIFGYLHGRILNCSTAALQQIGVIEITPGEIKSGFSWWCRK
jgi:hypothetical protein